MKSLPNRGLMAILVLGLVSCASNNSTFAPASTSNAGIGSAVASFKSGRNYLWVDRETAHDAQLIERHLLQDGIPEKAADFTIRGMKPWGYGEFIAVAGDGTLFVEGNADIYAGPIYAFAPGQHQPERSFNTPAIRACTRNPSNSIVTTALAADAAGYTFVSFTTYAGGAGPRRKAKPALGSECD